MTIGESDTLALRPTMPSWIPGYAKGFTTGITINPKVRGLSYVYDSFDSVDDWINVHNRLRIDDGVAATTGIGYAAGYHKTQMLSDNCRAKVTLQPGSVKFGESRVVVCADQKFSRYYGVAIRKNALTASLSIIRGRSSIAVTRYETTTVTLGPGDEIEVWYDRINSVVRVYKNDSEIAKKYFAPNDIPHGAGCRYTGIVMGTNWLVDVGPNFSDFEAWDVYEPAPEVYDPIDSKTVNAGWVTKLGAVEIHSHRLYPLTLGPQNALYTSAAVRWTTPLNTDSAKVVISAWRIGLGGKFTLVVRSDANMTNWIGIQFNQETRTIRAVTGTGPNTITNRGTAHTWAVVRVGQEYTVTWDDSTKTIRCYRGANRTPIVEWAASTSFTGTGRYVGMVWTSGLLFTGVEPTSFNAYDVTADQPLPVNP